MAIQENRGCEENWSRVDAVHVVLFWDSGLTKAELPDSEVVGESQTMISTTRLPRRATMTTVPPPEAPNLKKMDSQYSVLGPVPSTNRSSRSMGACFGWLPALTDALLQKSLDMEQSILLEIPDLEKIVSDRRLDDQSDEAKRHTLNFTSPFYYASMDASEPGENLKVSPDISKLDDETMDGTFIQSNICQVPQLEGYVMEMDQTVEMEESAIETKPQGGWYIKIVGKTGIYLNSYYYPSCLGDRADHLAKGTAWQAFSQSPSARVAIKNGDILKIGDWRATFTFF